MAQKGPKWRKGPNFFQAHHLQNTKKISIDKLVWLDNNLWKKNLKKLIFQIVILLHVFF